MSSGSVGLGWAGFCDYIDRGGFCGYIDMEPVVGRKAAERSMTIGLADVCLTLH